MLNIFKDHPKINIQNSSLGITKWCKSIEDFAKCNRMFL